MVLGLPLGIDSAAARRASGAPEVIVGSVVGLRHAHDAVLSTTTLSTGRRSSLSSTRVSSIVGA
jgi:hypothetical protein